MRMRSSRSTEVETILENFRATGRNDEVWQLDFSSRPIVDERGKKVWEMLLCDEAGRVRVSQFFANNQVSSGSLRNALSGAIDEAFEAGIASPRKIRFFRGQMTTIISRACNEIGIEVEASRRCEALLDWMDERFETTYKKHEGFDEQSYISSCQLNASTALRSGVPGVLPDALIAEQWLFVQLPLSELLEEAKGVQRGEVFGNVSQLSNINKIGFGVPGLCVYSRRSSALSAYMSSYDVHSVYPDCNRLTLVLGSGLNDLYRFGALEESDVPEAEAWEAAKQRASGVHFLAIAPNQESDQIDGFWLLQERELPSF